MSTQSKKKGRPTVPRDPDTFLPRVSDTVDLLTAAGAGWDRGERFQTASLVMALRLLFVDRLLDRVTKLDKLQMLSSTPPLLEPEPGTGMHYVGVGGLTLMRMGGADPAGSGVVPLCDAPVPRHDMRYVPFRYWWDVDRVVRHDELLMTRRFVVYEMANTLIAHMGADLDAEYAQLRGPLGSITMDDGSGPRPVDGVAEAAARQIAWEAEHTLRPLIESGAFAYRGPRRR